MLIKADGLPMPLWEKILVLLVIAFSIGSIYALLVRSVYFDDEDDINITTEESSKHEALVLRSQWSALPPRGPLKKLSILPPPYVIISHSVQKYCSSSVQCKKSVQLIQGHHQEMGWADIGYNFVVGGDGNVYVGRGWDIKGAHARTFNNRSIGISFIGDFRFDEPLAEQVLAAKRFIEYGVNISKISADYKLLGHNQVSQTLSPGPKLFQIIRTWEHWSPEP